jgi:hypothetical protein
MLLKLNPDDPEALALGARSLYDAGRIKEAQALTRRLSEVERVSEHGSMPVAPLRSSETPRLQSLNRPPLARDDSETALLADDAIEDAFDRDYPSDAFAPVELSEPEHEPMPIAQNPYIEDLELELPTRIREPVDEYYLPEERMTETEETTSRTELSPELASLRRAFAEEDATKLDILADEDPTIPPPDDFEDFTSKTRSQLMSELHKETSQGD